MKLLYIANIRFPTEKAHGIQVAKMCEAFAAQIADTRGSELPSANTRIDADDERIGTDGERIGTDKKISENQLANQRESANIEVELVVPKRRNVIKNNPFEYYGVEKTFQIKKLPTIDLVGIIPRLGFLVQSVSFAKFATLYALFKKPDIIYSRDEWPLWFLSFFRKNLVWESHRGQFSFLTKRVVRKCKGIVVITRGLKDFYVSKGVNPDKILVAPDGVDLKNFQFTIFNLQKLREELGLPVDKKIVMYTGHLYEWKGASVLLEAAKRILTDEGKLISSDEEQIATDEGKLISSDEISGNPFLNPRQSVAEDQRLSEVDNHNQWKSVLFVFVGGTEADIKLFREKAGKMGMLDESIGGNPSSPSVEISQKISGNPSSPSVEISQKISGNPFYHQRKSVVRILGHKPHSEISKYLAAADVLVLPTSGKSEMGRKYTSPMKLFEYMAAGKPIVASDLPSIREVLNENNAVLVESDDHQKLAEKINQIFDEPELAQRISKQASEDALNFSWNIRAENILKGLKL